MFGCENHVGLVIQFRQSRHRVRQEPSSSFSIIIQTTFLSGLLLCVILSFTFFCQVELCSDLGISQGGIFFFEELGKSEPSQINALHFKVIAI